MCTFRRVGKGFVVDGVKWWSSGAMDPRCKVAIVLGRIIEETYDGNPTSGSGGDNGSSNGSGGKGSGSSKGGSSRRAQQTMLLVPMDAPGVRIIRPLTVFGYDDAPHGHAEVALEVSGPTAYHHKAVSR